MIFKRRKGVLADLFIVTAVVLLLNASVIWQHLPRSKAVRDYWGLTKKGEVVCKEIDRLGLTDNGYRCHLNEGTVEKCQQFCDMLNNGSAIYECTVEHKGEQCRIIGRRKNTPQRVTNKTRTGVAACITGEFRTMAILNQAKHMKSWLNEVNPDIFLNVALHFTVQTRQWFPQRYVKPLVNQKKIIDSIRYIQPRAFILEPDEMLVEDAFFKEHGDIENVYYHRLLYRNYKCLDLIKRAEAERRLKYRWILRTRPDVLYAKKLPLPGKWPGGEEAMQHYGGLPIDQYALAYEDYTYIMARGSGEIYMSAFPYVNGFLPCTTNIPCTNNAGRPGGRESCMPMFLNTWGIRVLPYINEPDRPLRRPCLQAVQSGEELGECKRPVDSPVVFEQEYAFPPPHSKQRDWSGIYYKVDDETPSWFNRSYKQVCDCPKPHSALSMFSLW